MMVLLASNPFARLVSFLLPVYKQLHCSSFVGRRRYCEVYKIRKGVLRRRQSIKLDHLSKSMRAPRLPMCNGINDFIVLDS